MCACATKDGVALKLVPWTDARGERHWVEVEASAAAELERFDRWARRRERRFRDAHALATDVRAARRPQPQKDRNAARVRLVGYLCYEMEPAARAARLASDDGYPWEGRRAAFTLLMGESPTWGGPQEWYEHVQAEGAKGGGVALVRSVYGNEASSRAACRLCGPIAELPPYAVCLHCCRSGRDGEIGAGAPRTEPKSHRKGKLKGGVG